MKLQATIFLSASVSLAIFISHASADTIVLQDGRTLSGSISRQGDNALIKTTDGSITTVPFFSVARVTLNDNAPTADPVQSDYTRLVAQVKSAATLPEIIALHQKFLEQHPDSPLVKDARESLASYQQLADAHAVKFHGQWLPPDQIDVLQKQALDAAAPALDAYAAGKIKEALDLAAAVLAKDSQNASALAISGLAACRSGDLALARKYFTDLAQSDPTSLLAQNNLAVISYRQNRIGDAMFHYVAALQIALDSRPLLDNITEAIHSYTSAGGDKNSSAFRALSNVYSPAETNLETNLAKKNLRRYGSAWLTTEDRDAAVNKLQLLRDKQALLDVQYQATTASLAALNLSIQQAQQLYQQTQNTATSTAGEMTTFTGAMMARPDTYAGIGQYRQYDRASSQQAALEAQRDALVVRLADFAGQAEELKAQIAGSAVPFTGHQQLIDLRTASNDSDLRPSPNLPLLAAQTASPVPALPPLAPSRDVEAILAGSDPENSAPLDHGGVYNPPSIIPYAPPQRTVSLPMHLVVWHPTLIVLKPLPAVIWSTQCKIVEHLAQLPDGNIISSSAGYVNLPSDGSLNFNYNPNTGKWTVTQNNSLLYESGLSITYQMEYGYLTGAQLSLLLNEPTSGVWVLNQQGQAVRETTPPLTGP